jgi:hypothetical protein
MPRLVIVIIDLGSVCFPHFSYYKFYARGYSSHNSRLKPNNPNYRYATEPGIMSNPLGTGEPGSRLLRDFAPTTYDNPRWRPTINFGCDRETLAISTSVTPDQLRMDPLTVRICCPCHPKFPIAHGQPESREALQLHETQLRSVKT